MLIKTALNSLEASNTMNHLSPTDEQIASSILLGKGCRINKNPGNDTFRNVVEQQLQLEEYYKMKPHEFAKHIYKLCIDDGRQFRDPKKGYEIVEFRVAANKIISLRRDIIEKKKKTGSDNSLPKEYEGKRPIVYSVKGKSKSIGNITYLEIIRMFKEANLPEEMREIFKKFLRYHFHYVKGDEPSEMNEKDIMDKIERAINDMVCSNKNDTTTTDPKVLTNNRVPDQNVISAFEAWLRSHTNIPSESLDRFLDGGSPDFDNDVTELLNSTDSPDDLPWEIMYDNSLELPNDPSNLSKTPPDKKRKSKFDSNHCSKKPTIDVDNFKYAYCASGPIISDSDEIEFVNVISKNRVVTPSNIA